MLSVEDALRAVASAAGAPRVTTETVPLGAAVGRVLAEDVLLDHDAPPFDRATMDGFAVRSADVVAGAVLRVAGRVHAGAASRAPLTAGAAVAIMTGAPLPAGADAVVPVERVEVVEGSPGAEVRVRVPAGFTQGRHVARRGEQAARGEVVAAAGTWIHAGTVGVLAAAGRVRVAVAARPRVRILATGDEVVPADRVPGPSQIRDSNGHALAAQCARAGADGRYTGPVPDEPAALRAAVDAALESAELLCLSGGVSMGDRDHVPRILEEAGVERIFHRWSVKPGGPLWFGRRGDTLVFGLPGNPAATFVGFEVLVVPALRTRLGLPFTPRTMLPAAWSGPPVAPIARRQYVPVDLGLAGPVLTARAIPWAGSGDLFALGRAAGLAVVPEQGAAVPESPSAGPGTVEVLPLGTLLGRLPT